MGGYGPRPFPTGTTVIPAGTTGSVVISPTAATLTDIINAANVTSVAVSVNIAGSAAAVNAANCIYDQQLLGAGQIYTFNTYCLAGIVLTFGSATTDNITVTFTPLNGGA